MYKFSSFKRMRLFWFLVLFLYSFRHLSCQIKVINFESVAHAIFLIGSNNSHSYLKPCSSKCSGWRNLVFFSVEEGCSNDDVHRICNFTIVTPPESTDPDVSSPAKSETLKMNCQVATYLINRATMNLLFTYKYPSDGTTYRRDTVFLLKTLKKYLLSTVLKNF